MHKSDLSGKKMFGAFLAWFQLLAHPKGRIISRCEENTLDTLKIILFLLTKLFNLGKLVIRPKGTSNQTFLVSSIPHDERSRLSKMERFSSKICKFSRFGFGV